MKNLQIALSSGALLGVAALAIAAGSETKTYVPLAKIAAAKPKAAPPKITPKVPPKPSQQEDVAVTEKAITRFLTIAV